MRGFWRGLGGSKSSVENSRDGMGWFSNPELGLFTLNGVFREVGPNPCGS